MMHVDQAAAEHLARVHDAARVDLGLVRACSAATLLGAQHAVGLAAEVQAGRVRGAAVRLGDLDDRQRQREREVEVERALVVRDEAEQHDLVALADHALEDERLLDLVVDLAEDRGHLGQRNDDLGRNDRRADALEAHRGETLLPLVLGRLGVEFGAAVAGDDLRERRVDRAAPRLRIRDDREVGLGKLRLEVVVRHLVRDVRDGAEAAS